MGLALDEPEKDDIVVTINEIKVAIDPIIEPNTEDLVLDLSGDKINPGLVMLGNTGHCC